MTNVDPDRVVAAVLACPDVVRMAGGAVAEVACYLPGRRVEGVKIGDDGVEVHIVAALGRPLPDVAADVRRAVGPLAATMPVTVSIDDVELPGGAGSPASAQVLVAAP
ncbi:MAG TPA: hypothetical protein VHM89_16435 [Acidimicrobiales bacterium]|nr:hypothetical protein [Acidimicrobiales bacterium]